MDKRFFFLINTARNRMFKFADTVSESRAGLTVTQSAALMFIARQEGCQQKALADAMQLNQPAVTGLVNRMSKNGLIKKTPSPDDGRAFELHLTAKGRKKLPEILSLLDEFNSKLTATFSAAEIETVARFLNHVITDFDGSSH